MKKSILLIIILFVASTFGYAKETASAYYAYETVCLGVALDGSQILRAWGIGRTRADAKDTPPIAIQTSMGIHVNSINKLCTMLRPMVLK